MTLDISKVAFRQIGEVALAPERAEGYYQVMRDVWWISHPEHGLAFYKAKDTRTTGRPLCNYNKYVAERLKDSLFGANTVFELTFVPVALIPINLRDFS